jgi:hypothetical protein
MTDPETCRHNVIAAGISKELELQVHCVSCGKDMTDLTTRVGKNYVYDVDNNLWVHHREPKKFLDKLHEIEEIVREANVGYPKEQK